MVSTDILLCILPVNDDVKALTTEQLDKIRIPVYKQLHLKLIWKKVKVIPSSFK